MNSLFSSCPRQSNSSSLSPSLSPSLSSSLSPSFFCNTLNKRPQPEQLVIRDTPCAVSLIIPRHASATPKYALGRRFRDEEEDPYDDDDINAATVTVQSGSTSSSLSYSSASSTSSSVFHAAMSMRSKMKRQVMDSLSASTINSSPNNNKYNTTAGHGRPSTPTTPVQIPKRGHRDNVHHANKGHLHHPSRRQHKHVHIPDAVSPSVAALLAITDIPRPHRTRRPALRSFSVSADEVMSDQDVSEKAFSLSPNRGPLDLLLSPPEDLMDDDLSPTESNMGSLLARTISADSVPSLSGESCATEFCSSMESPRSIIMPGTRRRSSLVRKSLEPVRSPPDATDQHPLAIADADADADVDDFELEGLDLPFPQESGANLSSYPLLQPFKPLRTAFKSNLTASLRALKSAAKSFSSINFSYIPADDLLTRSILTIDPHVPYMDERRPPVTEEMPSAELRRYLNPTTSNHFDAQPTARSAGTYSASIQLQTYKIERSRSLSPSSTRTPHHSPHSLAASASRSQPCPSHTASSSSNSRSMQQNAAKSGGYQVSIVPGMRQREMRENPDFIRIAVMEMAMRRRGKLDNQKPGRARWALPPRRPSTKPYEVGSTGIPTRWIPITY
ncbi:hypothetical protein E4U43_004234 [Claviceps pusilla]|uniref:Uncharacterized protein n=1 Tax=Claviceps pusilla TaxID=123648 RepID=A0A9P7SU30_9HYPO|nr:hypothetical protein E4U43_004234 [Claviceps pusilla]